MRDNLCFADVLKISYLSNIFQVWLIFEMFMAACLYSASNLCPRSLLTWEQFFFQSEYLLYPQFLTWLITWWLIKNMKKSKRRIQKARFNFSSRFFVRIFISELKFAALFPIYVSRLKSWSPFFSWRHMSPLFSFAANFARSIWGRVANFATKLGERLFSV